MLAGRGLSLGLRGSLCGTCVRRVLVQGREIWAVRGEDRQRMVRTERSMVRRMCGVSLKDRQRSGTC